LARDLTEPMELEEGLPHLIGGVERDLLPAPQEMPPAEKLLEAEEGNDARI
jgi:hypothetical protein